MFPLQLTDAALNASPIPPKPGMIPVIGVGEFAAMFDLVPPPEGDDALVPLEPGGSGDVPLPDPDVEAAIAVPLIAAPETVKRDAVPVGDPAAVEPLPGAIAEDVNTDVAILRANDVHGRALPPTDKAMSAALQTSPRASLAQTMVEGRFPQPQPKANAHHTAPALPDAEVPQTPQVIVQQAAPRPDAKMIADASTQPVRTDSPPPVAPAAIPSRLKVLAAVPPTAIIPPTAAEDFSRAMQAPVRPQPAEAVPSREVQTDKIPADLKQGPPSIPFRTAIVGGADIEKTASTPARVEPATGTHHVTAAILGGGGAEKAAKTPARAEPLFDVPQGFALSERSTAPAQHATVTAAPTTAGAETARQVAGQISVAMTGQPGRATDIALNPEELGRVRLRMTAVDQSITLHILAERPETTDLLRRHIDVLAQEFRALGYNNISFSFGGGQGAGNASTDTNAGFDGPVADPDVVEPDIKTVQAAGQQTGLDLRL